MIAYIYGGMIFNFSNDNINWWTCAKRISWIENAGHNALSMDLYTEEADTYIIQKTEL